MVYLTPRVNMNLYYWVHDHLPHTTNKHLRPSSSYVPGSINSLLGMVIPPLWNPYHGYINHYDWVNDHPKQHSRELSSEGHGVAKQENWQQFLENGYIILEFLRKKSVKTCCLKMMPHISFESWA